MVSKNKNRNNNSERTGRNKILQDIHLQIHALRLVPNYKPSMFETKMNQMIAEEFSTTCKECKERFEKSKYAPAVPTKEGFFSKIGRLGSDTIN
jgi:hypothetical protein